MKVTARIHASYLGRLKLMALGCIGMALWFAYDGTFTYPRQRERALEYERLKDEARLGEWSEVAAKNDWSDEFPGEPKTEAEIYAQLVLGAVVAVPGLLCIIVLLVVRKRWIEMDENGLRSSWGKQLTFDQITLLNKKQWKKKGIAKVRYEQDGGKRQLVLDDWKYDTEPTVEMVREIESHIELEQIIGGPPEAAKPEEEPAAPEEEPVAPEETDEPEQ